MRALITFTVLWIIHLATIAQEYQLPLVSPFEQLRVNGGIHLQLVASDSLNLQVEGEAMPENLVIELSENRLTLKTRTQLKSTPSIPVKLFYTNLSTLHITRGAVVQSADTLKAQTLSLKVETGGKVELFIATDSLSARINQGADIILRGRSRSQQVNAYTLGNYLGYELETESTWIKAATGAQVKVNSTHYLNANATSKAFIGYLGSPEETEFKTSVGGEITQQKP